MAEQPADLRAEIERLRDLLAELGQRQADEVRAMRQQLGALERIVAELATTRSGPPTAAAPEPPEELAPAPIPPPIPNGAAPAPPQRILTASPTPAPEPARTAEPAATGVAGPAIIEPAPPTRKRGSLELQMGRVWFVRIGIALLVTGLVLLGTYAYRNWVRELPAAARLACLYAGSLAICGTGVWVGRRDGLRRFGEVVLAGGLAFFYWCTYAAHHVDRLRVVDSPVAAAVLLLTAAGVMVAVSLRRDSRITAVLGLLLASYSTVLQPLGWLSAVSNLVLAGAGVGLMLRPGWAGPGVAAMAGSYGAFLWWQLLGAAGGDRNDPVALWFLPPVWAMFALPGLLGRFANSLGERARAWLTGVNNIVFFGLFSLVWLMEHGGDSYWQVPAVFGLVLLLLGGFGRSSDRVAGGVHLAQALGALMFATILKLEGYQLALGLAGEALALALAFLRFRGRSELAFAALAGGVATLFAFFDLRLGHLLSGHFLEAGTGAPLWSTGMVAILLAAAAGVMRTASDRVDGRRARLARAVTMLKLLGGTLVAVFLWCPNLASPWPVAAAAGIALALNAGSLLGDRRRWLPELGWVAVLFSITAVVLLIMRGPAWSALVVSGLAGASCWLWHRRVPEPAQPPTMPPDPARIPAVPAWINALIVPIGLVFYWASKDLPAEAWRLQAGIAAVVLTVAALWLRCERLAVSATLLHLAGLIHLPKYGGEEIVSAGFETPLLAGVTGGITLLPWARSRLPGLSLQLVQGLSRGLAFLAWWWVWFKFSPGHWPDVMAVSAVAVVLVGIRLRQRRMPLEASGFIAIAIVVFFTGIVPGPWRQLGADGIDWELWTVAPAVLACAVLSRRSEAVPGRGPAGLFLLGAVMLAMWGTRLLVWRFGWEPAGVLWTVLGFGYVCAGLWLRLAPLRQCGFALLAIALVKLFAVDVWNFEAFVRIAAFLALGVALVVLGFFYNRFADVLKRLLEADESGPRP